MSTRKTAQTRIALLQGTLDPLILRTVLFGPQHGQGIARAIQQQSDETLLVDHGSLYPALKRLEREGLLRRVPYSVHPPRDEYELTPQGRELGGVLEALAVWGTKHFPGTRRRPRTSAEQDPPQE